MKARWILASELVLVLLLVLTAGSGQAQGGVAPQAAMGTAFTYQGGLADGGCPANGQYDLKFELYDAEVEGNQVGTTIAVDDKQVDNGLFTVKLDFGSSAFTGDARWLEIGLRRGDETGAYTLLSPRQELTPGLYSLNADLLDGQHASAFAPASHTHSGSEYQNVIIVANSGGDFISIQSALDSISDNGASNRYLVWVAPGTYIEQVTMKPYVDIEGAGELLTKIAYTGSESMYTGTLLGASDAELRFLTVENTGGSHATAIFNGSASPRLTYVTAIASGGTGSNRGVHNQSFSSPTMTNVTASASGGSGSFGVYNNPSSSPTMIDVTASASGGSNWSVGVYNNTSSPTMTNVTASASGTTKNVGVYNDDSSSTIQNSVISASGGTRNYGMHNTGTSGTHTVTVNHSQITGSTNTIRNHKGAFTTLVGASLLDGGNVEIVTGTVTCAGVHDENYTFYSSTCP